MTLTINLRSGDTIRRAVFDLAQAREVLSCYPKREIASFRLAQVRRPSA